MKITKIGHCCLLIEEQGIQILTDPGAWTEAQNQLTGINIVLITHEHADHFHLESLRAVLKNNPQARVLTNPGVGKLIQAAGLACEFLEDGEVQTVNGLELSGHGRDHAPIYPGVPAVTNTGYMIAQRLYYPGDSFHQPGQPVEILALPVAGPWMKIAEALDFAKAVKPKVAFPVHDGMLKIMTVSHGLPQRFLPETGIAFEIINPGESRTF